MNMIVTNLAFYLPSCPLSPFFFLPPILSVPRTDSQPPPCALHPPLLPSLHRSSLVPWPAPVAESLEQACIDTVEHDGIMTKDLALACGKSGREDYVTTTEYLNAVEKRMKGLLKEKL